MRFKWLTIKSNHFKESKEFYQEVLGFQMDREFCPAEGIEIAFLKDDKGMVLELINVEADALAVHADGLSLGLQVRDYEGLLEKARSGGYLEMEPQILGGLVECYFIQDPNGLSLQIMKEDPV